MVIWKNYESAHSSAGDQHKLVDMASHIFSLINVSSLNLVDREKFIFGGFYSSWIDLDRTWINKDLLSFWILYGTR